MPRRWAWTPPDGRAIFEAAAAGNARTLAVLNDWISEIAQGLAGLVHIFNPQLILIGGGVSAQQELLIDPLAAQVCKSVMPAFAEGLEIKAAALQNDAGLVGAVYYFRENHLPQHHPVHIAASGVCSRGIFRHFDGYALLVFFAFKSPMKKRKSTHLAPFSISFL